MINKINKKITGNIINSESEIFQIALYQIINQDYKLIDKTESNIYGSFEFGYLNSGQYIAVSVENFNGPPNIVSLLGSGTGSVKFIFEHDDKLKSNIIYKNLTIYKPQTIRMN